MTWEQRRLKDVAELSLGKMLDQKKNKGSPRPYLANINVRWGALNFASLREMRFEAHESGQYGLKSGDIVMCEGGEPGRCAIWDNQIPGMMIQKALHRIRAKKGMNPRFLLYWLLHLGKSGDLDHLFTGSTIKHLPSEQLAKVQVPVPAYSTQRRIAAILSAYDDLIEVNRRRVAILEDMARRLFEEWFVHFRFPGHATTPLHDTPSGPVPDGWISGVVGDLLTLHRGYDLATTARQPGTIPVMTGSGRNGTHDTAKVAGPGVVTGRSGTVGQVFLVHEDFWPLNTALYVSAYKAATPAYALFLLRASRLQAHAGGAAVPTLNRNHVHALPALRPPVDLIQQFDGLVMPMLESARALERQNDTLAAARDLLLPRLLSGQLSVASTPQAAPMLLAAE